MIVFLAPPGAMIGTFGDDPQGRTRGQTCRRHSRIRAAAASAAQADVAPKQWQSAALPRSVHIHGCVFPNPFLSEDSRNEVTSLSDYRRYSRVVRRQPRLKTVLPARRRDGQAAANVSQAQAAMDRAAAAQKYVFLFFWKDKNPQTDKAWSVLQPAVAKLADSAEVVSIQITDPAEKQIVDQYDVSRAPMPLVLAVAPCGAITKAFTEDIR